MEEHRSTLESEMGDELDFSRDIAEARNSAEFGEALYLMTRLLKGQPGLSGTLAVLTEELEKSEFLGTVRDWQGTARPAHIKDMDAKYRHLPSCHLLNHLQQSLSLERKKQKEKDGDREPFCCSSSSASIRDTLLQPISGQYDPNNEKEADDLEVAGALLASALQRQRGIISERDDTMRRIGQIRSRLKELERREEMERCVGGEDDAENVDRELKSKLDQTVVQHAGATRKLRREEQALSNLEAELEQIDSISQLHLKKAAKLGGLRAPLRSHSIHNNSAVWLHARALGMTSLGGNAVMGAAAQALQSQSMKFTRNRLTSYKHLWTVSAHMCNPTFCVTFDLSGRYALSGADDYNIKIWDCHRGMLMRTCRGHKGYITFIAISADNSMFASACTQGDIRVWSLQSGNCLKCLRHMESRYEAQWLQFDPRGALISAANDGQCVVWDLCHLLAPADVANSPLLSTSALHSTRKVLCSEENMDIEMSECGENSDGDSAKMQEIQGGSMDIDTNNETDNSDMYPRSDSEIVTERPEHKESASGVFPWSRPGYLGEISGKLGLPHLPDVLGTNGQSSQLSQLLDDPLDEEKLLVTCLDISPGGGLLTTGCSDGVVRLWAYDSDTLDPFNRIAGGDTGVSSSSTVDNEEEGVPRRRGTRSAEAAAAPSVHPVEKRLDEIRQILPEWELKLLEPVVRHLLLRLQGHTQSVTDVSFSHCGDRLATASLEDGTVRIWAVKGDYSHSEHIILSMAETDSPRLARASVGRRRMIRGHDNAQAYNICWTADDSSLITLQGLKSDSSPTRLKMWDSFTGDLLRMINSISDMPCRQLRAHPIEPNIVLTGGDDGILSVWDVEREEKIFSHKVQCRVDLEKLQINDISFSPDGTYIIASDSDGCITSIGVDSKARHAESALYPEQYFSTDHAEIEHDDDGQAIDVGTHLLVNETPLGALCNMHLHAYEVQPILSAMPPTIPPLDVQAAFEQRMSKVSSTRQAMQASYNQMVKHKLSGRTPKQYMSERRRVEEQKAAAAAAAAKNASANTTSNKRSGRRMWYMRNDSDSAEIEVNDSDEEVYNPQDGINYGDNEELTNLWNPTRRQRGARTSNGMRRAGRRQGTAMGSDNDQVDGEYNHDDDDDDDEDDEDDDGDYAPERRPRTRGNRGSTRFGGRRSSRRTRGRQQTSRATRRLYRNRNTRSSRNSESNADLMQEVLDLMDSDNDAFASDSEETSVENLYDSDEEQQRNLRRLKKNKEVQAARRAANGSRGSRNASTSRASSSSSSSNRGGARGAQWTRSQVPLNVEVQRLWLQADKPSEHQYAPQLGDRVVYFPQGHMESLHLFAEDSSPPWLAFPARWPLVLCLVTNIEYSFPLAAEHTRSNSLVVSVTLSVIGTPTQQRINSTMGTYRIQFAEPRQSRQNTNQIKDFTITLRDCGVPDFLVLEHRFLRATKLPWHQGIRVQCAWHDLDETGNVVLKVYPGRVHGLKNRHDDWMHSPWEALQVEWEKEEHAEIDDTNAGGAEPGAPGTIDCIGLWEASHAEMPHDAQYVKEFESIHVPVLNADLAERLHDAINASMIVGGEKYLPFEWEVDASTFPDYYCIVPLPMTVDLLRRRLRSGFYRTLAAVEADMARIAYNAKLFNLEGSEIIEWAQELSEKLVELLYSDPDTLRHVADEAESQGRGTRAQSKKRAREGAIRSGMWHVLCDRCRKWRSAPDTVDRSSLPEVWLCELNYWDPEHNTCDAPQEDHLDDENTIHGDSSTRMRRRSTQSSIEQHNSRHVAQSSSSSSSSSSKTALQRRKKNGKTRQQRVRSADKPSKLHDIYEAEDEDQEENEDENEAESGEEGSSEGVSSGDSDEDDEDSSDNDPSSDEDTKKRRPSQRKATKKAVRKLSGRQKDSQRTSRARDDFATGTSSRENTRVKSKRSYADISDYSDEDTEGEREKEVDVPSQPRKRKNRRRTSESSSSVALDVPLQTFDFAVNEEKVLRSRGPQRVDINTKKQMVQLLEDAYDADEDTGIFLDPVSDDVAPGYHQMIIYPMCLKTISERLDQRLYANCDEMADDLRLMYANALFYNLPDSEIANLALHQRRLVLEE